MNTIAEKINALKKEKNAIILAHYYVNDEIQEIADFVGDSYQLSVIASENDADVIVFAGVSFMGESAKVVNPEKLVLMPDKDADCPMAHMVTLEKIKEVREKYDDLAVVCYINSTVEIKTEADVCVTSANALKIVSKLKQKNIFFVPDQNLGQFVAKHLPEKNFIFNEGYCPIHHNITVKQVEYAKKKHPEALFLAHPECRPEILDMADYAGSTSGILKFATESENKEFIIGTEIGIFYKLREANPQKHFYSLEKEPVCEGMKMISLEKIYDALKNETNQVRVSAETRTKAERSINEMLLLSSN